MFMTLQMEKSLNNCVLIKGITAQTIRVKREGLVQKGCSQANQLIWPHV